MFLFKMYFRLCRKQKNKSTHVLLRRKKFHKFYHLITWVNTSKLIRMMTKKTFIFIILALISAPGSLSWAALFGSSDGSWLPSAFPQTFMDNIKNCQAITHEDEHEQTLKTSNYRIHISSCRFTCIIFIRTRPLLFVSMALKIPEKKMCQLAQTGQVLFTQ